MAVAKYPGYEALNPFFEIVQKGLAEWAKAHMKPS